MRAIEFSLDFFPSVWREKVVATLPQVKAAFSSLVAKECRGAEFTGWFNWPDERGFALVDQIKETLNKLKPSYNAVVVVGIGGSYLGTRAVSAALGSEYDALGKSKHRPIFFAGQHLSGRALGDLLATLEGFDPIINVISKSGTTTEPAVAFRVLRSYLEKRYGVEGANQRIIATTDPKSGALRQLATECKWTSFEVPADVGGRFSVLTAVGLVPLALAGYDISALMSGADFEFRHLLKNQNEPTAALTYAASRYVAYQAGKCIELLAYAEPGLNYLVEWWKQLFGESEGKDGKGVFPAALAYTTDLHSLGQLAQDGERNIFETFLTFAAPANGLKVPNAASNVDELTYLEGVSLDHINDTAMAATKLAHVDGGVPCLSLKLGELNEFTLGQLFAFFETACAVSAALLAVNPFDQPGVEAYKKNLFAMLGKPGHEALRERLEQRLRS